MSCTEGRGSDDSSSKTSSPAAIIGGALLVGAAAGYALIAFRFKHLKGGGAVRTEIRAAEVFSEQASRVRWSASARAEGRADEMKATTEQVRQFAKAQAAAHAVREEARRRQGLESVEQRGAAQALSKLGLQGTPLHSLNLEVVKAAYHAKARSCHPDTSGSADPEAFKQLGNAYKEVVDLLAAHQR